ncbi:SGNH/GDSL hydrolase family protein [Actinoplanes sp. TBRC 11911]|uniref:GDSL-type esterase/lipase family protein n=1 Tax=Actinoplanes sp. TBRC 11911 TaxID=2729386 RepID=UPI00145CFFEF|nr:GDSL-type esterase/lipase family protein [Actinoplanes sp. TBRC 11911]NMO49685.1 SGNH/GDSL hydrolase family protein [Actinoplanes sp. TBRC 11911]
MIWTAGFRTAVIDPREKLQFGEPRGFADQTVSQLLQMAGGGDAFRVRLTNRYGRTPLVIGAATVRTAHQRTPLPLTFDGAARFVIAAGAEAVSDPVDVPVAAGSDIVLNLYFPERTDLATYSHRPAEIARIVAGDQTAARPFAGIERAEARYFVSGVDVPAPDHRMIGAAFGDSWFEGVGTTPGAKQRSVDFLNRRLRNGWIVNLGISGNRLLRDGVGEAALARFEREVLSIPALTHVLVSFGINDLILPDMLGEPAVSAGDLIAGYIELAERAHLAGLRILVSTIGPFAGYTPETRMPELLAVRREVNDWIRTARYFDGVFDVARAVADPRFPDYIHRDLDSGDGLHLNEVGTEVMADTVDIRDLTL